MMLFRAANKQDLQAIHALAKTSGVGMTTFPKDITLLEKRLTQAHHAFNTSLDTPDDEYYLFVLEDTTTHQIVGTAAIEALTGKTTPFYSYRRTVCLKTCPSLHLESTHDYLSLVHDNEGCTEICTLYLNPTYRRDSNGLLLSLARFLFMAEYPQRFASRVIADMRGVSDEQGNSPFWDAVGYPFFQIPFTQADQLTLSTDKQFIADLIPRYPIYINLLPLRAQIVLGHPHASTVPAMNILFREGFTHNQTIDIFDAGPTLEVEQCKIRTLANSQRMTLSTTPIQLKQQRVLLASTELHFR